MTIRQDHYATNHRSVKCPNPLHHDIDPDGKIKASEYDLIDVVKEKEVPAGTRVVCSTCGYDLESENG